MMLVLLVALVGTAAGASLYGHWETRDNLPAYIYTADQSALAASALPPNAPFGRAAKKDTTGPCCQKVARTAHTGLITGGMWQLEETENTRSW